MNFEWLAECDACEWTAANPLVDVAYAMLARHNQSIHGDTVKGRVIPFVIDGLPTLPDMQGCGQLAVIRVRWDWADFG
jgi:hypothetical protein